jgi:hypothetical protein
MDAWGLYSPYSPSPPRKEETLKNYSDYVYAHEIEERDETTLPFTIFHARVLRALGITVSAHPILSDGLFMLNGKFLIFFRDLLQKCEPYFG